MGVSPPAAPSPPRKVFSLFSRGHRSLFSNCDNLDRERGREGGASVAFGNLERMIVVVVFMWLLLHARGRQVLSSGAVISFLPSTSY